jgi:hypothetical protein
MTSMSHPVAEAVRLQFASWLVSEFSRIQLRRLWSAGTRHRFHFFHFRLTFELSDSLNSGRSTT